MPHYVEIIVAGGDIMSTHIQLVEETQSAVVKAVLAAAGVWAQKVRAPEEDISLSMGMNTDDLTILVVDDEPNILEVVSAYLRRELYRVVTAADGEEALKQVGEHSPDLVVLDVMLPRLDGLEVCRRIRATSNTPIIMLTARGEETDKLIGLGMGADDYLTKPFSPRELVARIKAVLRRATPTAQSEPGADSALKFPGLRINSRTRAVETDAGPVELTAKEFDLLFFLASHPQEVFTRTQLLDQVWDYSYYGDTSTVTVHVRRLREKIESDPMRPRYIKTVWGVGYKFER
jgi:two-component system, OmpR family, response regulator VicR